MLAQWFVVCAWCAHGASHKSPNIIKSLERISYSMTLYLRLSIGHSATFLWRGVSSRFLLASFPEKTLESSFPASFLEMTPVNVKFSVTGSHFSLPAHSSLLQLQIQCCVAPFSSRLHARYCLLSISSRSSSSRFFCRFLVVAVRPFHISLQAFSRSSLASLLSVVEMTPDSFSLT